MDDSGPVSVAAERVWGTGRAALAWLPRGEGLPDAEWSNRHRAICAVVWIHALTLPVVGFLRGDVFLHALAEAGVIALCGVGAQVETFGQRWRSALATAGLLFSSALLVHIFDGLIELHFHFFVVVALAALYQAWTPFLIALAFVVVHHSVVGALAPGAVYNHPAATDEPLLWGLLHGAFVLAESVACLVYWRASEAAVAHERDSRREAEQAHRDLAHAQQLSGVGSWDWDLAHGSVTWSDQMYALAGVDREDFVPSVAGFLDIVHPEDRERVAKLLAETEGAGGALDFECRLARSDGTVRTIHARSEQVAASNGQLQRIRGTCHDVTERQRLQDAITHLAFHDVLTDLPNRRLLMQRLEQALDQLSDDTSTCAVLFVDLDDFKQVNDGWGHAVGDALLEVVARRIRHATRETDTVARMGGDEFVVLCDDADLATAHQCAERIEEALLAPVDIDGTLVTVAASVGIALADRGTSAATVLQRADQAMYAAKAASRPLRDVSAPAN